MSFIHNLQCLSLYFVVMVSVYSQLIMEKQEQYNQKKICKGIFVLMNYSNKKIVNMILVVHMLWSTGEESWKCRRNKIML